MFCTQQIPIKRGRIVHISTQQYFGTIEVLIASNYVDQNELLGKSPFRTKVRLGMKRFIAGDYPSLSTFAQNVTHIHSKQVSRLIWMMMNMMPLYNMVFAQNVTQIHGQHLPSTKFTLKNAFRDPPIELTAAIFSISREMKRHFWLNRGILFILATEVQHNFS